MKHGSLFSGIGGFDLAAEWMGWENVFHCEWNPFGQKVLKYYWPKAISYDDITKTDFTIHRGNIDILTGGFPCQPYSSAGRRRGKEDERHLWPHMLRAIKEIAPRYIVGENVRGLTNWNGGMVFEEVCAQMEDLGYQVAPFLIPASGVGAPHRRERIWFVAYANANGFCKQRGYDSGSKNDEWSNASFKWSANTKDIDTCNSSANLIKRQGFDARVVKKENGEEGQFAESRRICELDKANHESKRIAQIDRNKTYNNWSLVQDGQYRIQLSEHRGMAENKTSDNCSSMDRQENDSNEINRMDGDAPNTNNNRHTPSRESTKIEREWSKDDGIESKRGKSSEWIDGLDGFQRDATYTDSRRLEGSEEVRRNGINAERESESGIVADTNNNGLNECNSNNEVNASKGREYALRDINESNGDGDATETNGIGGWKNDWIGNGKSNVNYENGKTRAWETFPTQSPICNGDDGLSAELDGITFSQWRKESIKAGGNAIVPQVVYQIFKAIEQHEILTAPAPDTRQFV